MKILQLYVCIDCSVNLCEEKWKASFWTQLTSEFTVMSNESWRLKVFNGIMTVWWNVGVICVIFTSPLSGVTPPLICPQTYSHSSETSAPKTGKEKTGLTYEISSLLWKHCIANKNKQLTDNTQAIDRNRAKTNLAWVTQVVCVQLQRVVKEVWKHAIFSYSTDSLLILSTDSLVTWHVFEIIWSQEQNKIWRQWHTLYFTFQNPQIISSFRSSQVKHVMCHVALFEQRSVKIWRSSTYIT